MTQRFEAVLAVYGIPDDAGNVLTRQAAERMAEQAKGMKVTGAMYHPGQPYTVTAEVWDASKYYTSPGLYRITEVHIDGDEQQGRVVVTCEEVRG